MFKIQFDPWTKNNERSGTHREKKTDQFKQVSYKHTLDKLVETCGHAFVTDKCHTNPQKHFICEAMNRCLP